MSMADRPAGQPERPGPHRLTRSRTDRMVAGVCGGFAAYSGIDVNIVRLVMVLLAVLGGTGLLLYLVAWVIVPVEDAAARWYVVNSSRHLWRARADESRKRGSLMAQVELGVRILGTGSVGRALAEGFVAAPLTAGDSWVG